MILQLTNTHTIFFHVLLKLLYIQDIKFGTLAKANFCTKGGRVRSPITIREGDVCECPCKDVEVGSHRTMILGKFHHI